MAQISRPFQIALVGDRCAGRRVALRPARALVHVLVGLLGSAGAGPRLGRGPGKSSGRSNTCLPRRRARRRRPQRRLAKAHGAVATSQQNAKQLEEKSAQASERDARAGPIDGLRRRSPRPPPSTEDRDRAQAAQHRAREDHVSHVVHQRPVEAQLEGGDVVVVLFWNPKGSDDVAVHRAVMSLGGKQHKVAVTVATPGEVASFGTITRGVQVYGTPTVLVIGKTRQATVITGFTDTYAIHQAIAEARHA